MIIDCHDAFISVTILLVYSWKLSIELMEKQRYSTNEKCIHESCHICFFKHQQTNEMSTCVLGMLRMVLETPAR